MSSGATGRAQELTLKEEFCPLNTLKDAKSSSRGTRNAILAKDEHQQVLSLVSLASLSVFSGQVLFSR